MPTSIAHVLGGYIAADAADAPSGRRLRVGAILFLAVFVANVPDLDFVPGFVLGHAERFHRGASHSVAGGLLATGVLAPTAKMLFGGTLRRWVLLVFSVYGSHLVLDLLIRDPTGGPGIAVLWPLTDTRFSFNLPGQGALDNLRTLEPGFFRNGLGGALFRLNTLQVFVVDGIMIVPFLFFIPLRRSRKRAREAANNQPGA